MTEKPVLFSGEMVRAILAGRKTQTRRVVKPQPCGVPNQNCATHEWADIWQELDSERDPTIEKRNPMRCPYGAPGDRLWVRESGWLDKREGRFFAYSATPKLAKQSDIRDYFVTAQCDPTPAQMRVCYKRVPSIFMPRWASRITLEVTGVRVERLQSISEADAEAEGITDAEALIGMVKNPYVTAYADLWDMINGKRLGCAWADNPWVWCVEFWRVEGEA